MVCVDAKRLFLEYRRAVREWVASINQLQCGRSQLLFKLIEGNQRHARLAEHAYQTHIAEHDCMLGEDDLANVFTASGATGANLIMPADIAQPIRKSSGRVILCWQQERKKNR